MKDQMDVVVVGAGPVGLLAAIELTLGGASVVVLERLDSPSQVTKALGIGALGSEALERRGMAEAIGAAEERALAAMKRAAGQTGPEVRGKGPRLSGHFAGLTLIRSEAQREPERRAHPVDQHAIEAMLAARAKALGIEVRRSCEVTCFTQQTDGIDLEFATPSGNQSIRCCYLVGCDGGRSTIRKMAGFAFPGTDPTMTMYNSVVELDHPERLLPRGWRHTSGGVFSYGFLPDRLVMLDFSGPPADREAPVTREEIEAKLRLISGQEVRVTALQSGSRWTDNTRLVDTYRKGRVFLVGDAAHIHSPFGGQGLSLGLVDAANLGWKLARVLREKMPASLGETLLDSYTAERRPVAEAVLANTLAQMAIMRPDPQSAAMRQIVAKLMAFDEVNRFFGEMVSGLSVRYELGQDEAQADDFARERTGQLIGNKAVVSGPAGISLYDLMQDGRGVLLDASIDGQPSKLVSDCTQRIRCVTVATGPSMLIRPDACIAWVSQAGSLSGLDEALNRWFMPPAVIPDIPVAFSSIESARNG